MDEDFKKWVWDNGDPIEGLTGDDLSVPSNGDDEAYWYVTGTLDSEVIWV